MSGTKQTATNETIKAACDRFDLEQEILECWKVTNDITAWIETGASTQDFKVLADYYERKFEKLWSTFEQLISDGRLK